MAESSLKHLMTEDGQNLHVKNLAKLEGYLRGKHPELDDLAKKYGFLLHHTSDTHDDKVSDAVEKLFGTRPPPNEVVEWTDGLQSAEYEGEKYYKMSDPETRTSGGRIATGQMGTILK